MIFIFGPNKNGGGNGAVKRLKMNSAAENKNNNYFCPNKRPNETKKIDGQK